MPTTTRRKHWQKQKKERDIFMTKPGDSQTKKTIGMGHNHPPNEGEEQDNPTLWEIAKEHNVSYADAVPIQEDMRLKRDALKAACTLGEMRKDRTPLADMKKRAEEAEGELSIMKGIETNRVKEAQATSGHLQNELDRVKKDNNDLFLRIAELTEVEESHRNRNGKLQERLTEVEGDNKKLSNQIEHRIDQMRKAGL